MSNIYGKQIIPNDISALYWFDKYYEKDKFEANRQELAKTDGVAVGRYVLVRSEPKPTDKEIGKYYDSFHEVYRKVITSTENSTGTFLDYEHVAYLDALPPYFDAEGNTLDIKENYFNEKTVKDDPKAFEISDTAPTITIDDQGADKDKTGAPHHYQMHITIPQLGEAVGSVNSLLYGWDNGTRTGNVDNAPNNISNIKISGHTLEKDGVLGVLGAIPWNQLENIDQALWANKYLELTEDPGDSHRAKFDFLKLDGSNNMDQNAAIHWGSVNGPAILGSTNGNVLTITANTFVQSNANGTHEIAVYDNLRKIFDGTSGRNPYVLSNHDYYVNNGKLYNSNTSIPTGAICFIPVTGRG